MSTDDGLSQNSVVSIAQDSSGFIWFATQDGLNKYDGSNFTQYEVFFRDITSSENNQLGKLFVDSQGKIWMTTLDGGLQFCNPSTEKFTYVHGVEDASSILQWSDAEFWVTSFSKGLSKVLIKDDELIVEHIINDLFLNKIVRRDSLLYLASTEGILKFDPKTRDKEVLYPEIRNISDLILTEDEHLIISTLGHGLHIATNDDSASAYLELPTDLLIQDIHIDKEDRLWVATYGEGLFLVDDNQVTQFKTNVLDDTSISYNDILCIFEDQNDNLWFGTDGGGASLTIADRKPIYSLTNNQMPKNIPVDVVRAISTDQLGNLWIGTSGKGLTKLSKELDQISHYSTEEPVRYRLSSDRVMSLLHDRNQDLWIGTQDEGLMVKKDKSKSFTGIDNDMPAATIWDIKEADDNRLWLCTGNEGLILLDKNDLSWEKLSVRSGFEVLTNGNIRTIMKGPEEEYFVGTDLGDVFAVRTDSRQRKVSINRKNTGAIKSLYLDEDKLWVGTQQAGIIIVDLSNGKEIELNKSMGLPNNVVYSMLEQNETYVWISTNMGICQIDKRRVYSGVGDIVEQHLTAENGLIGNEFNTGAYHVSSDGKMYFGGIDGVNWFHPDEINKVEDPIDIRLLDLITTNRDGQDVKHIGDLTSIDLKHTDRNFQIRYVAQTFSKTKTKYRYKLEGINTEWIDNESNELVSFSNIPPGEYALLLNATNNDGVWGKNPIKFDINIIPAFWQTWWFKLLVIGSIIWLVWSLFSLRINEIKKTSSLKEQITKIEAKALKLQMNPHFLFNSLNAIDNYILKNERIIASEYLSKFSKLMRQILDYSEQNRITLTQELETLELYIKMEQLRFQNKFDFEIKIANEVNTNAVKLPPLILQPFVENAIWHGLMHLEEGGVLKVDILKDGDVVKCTIDDNGIGRERAAMINTKSATKHKSYGMRITEQRLSLSQDLNKAGASMKVIDKLHENGESAGTAVEISFSIKTA